MLRKLEISNYAIIDELSIEFSQGLNIITGETGAGKSILVGALSLILGDRADSAVLFEDKRKCIVEGVFLDSDSSGLKKFLGANDLEYDEELIIRREISPQGKSRAFVNDSPVNLDKLRILSSMLVDLHRQFDSLELGSSSFQLDVIDAIAGNEQLLSEYGRAFNQLRDTRRQLQELLGRKAAFSKEYDYNQFLFEELEKENYQGDELENLEAELELLTHADGIKNALAGACYQLKESEQPLVQKLKSLVNQLQGFVAIYPNLRGVLERLRSAHIELQDIASEIESMSDEITIDPGRIDEINQQLQTGQRLLKKHGVKTTRELKGVEHAISDKLQAVLHIDEEIENKESQERRLLDQAAACAKELSRKRHSQVEPIGEEVNRLLKKMGMPNARLKIMIQDIPLNENGMDMVQFLFDANNSQKFENLSKVASGGELSRLMLSIKSLVAETVDLPTMIFDEIDSGISGEAAKQVGIILKKLSLSRQIISITHQPQIAGKADAHFLVYKDAKGTGVKTGIRQLTLEERVMAIAKMLSGEKPTAAALANAREMVC